MPNKILRRPKVLDRTGFSKSTLYLRMAEGLFPRPISLGGRAVGWLEAEVETWLSTQIALSREGAGATSSRDFSAISSVDNSRCSDTVHTQIAPTSEAEKAHPELTEQISKPATFRRTTGQRALSGFLKPPGRDRPF